MTPIALPGRLRVHGVVSVAAMLLGLAQPLQAQTRAETIRGKVTTDSGNAITGATVIATMAPDRLVFRGTTDAAGQYELSIPAGTGDYLLYISAVGRTAFRKRITRVGSDSVFVVDAKLASAVQQLTTVAVKSARLTPTRGGDPDVSLPGDAEIDGVMGGIAPGEQGDLSALLGTLPGFAKTGDGVSALGLPASQNNVTLNGMSFPGMDLPRDARIRTRVSTTPFDPARGWFGGAAIEAQVIGPNPVYGFKQAHLTTNGRAGSGGTTSIPGLTASVGSSGRIDAANHYFYNFSTQGSRLVGDATTLFNATPTLMRDLGVAGDSVRRLAGILDAAAIRSTAPHSQALSQNASTYLRVERSAFPGQTVPTTMALEGYAKGSRVDGLGFSPSAVPSRGGSLAQKTGWLSGSMSHFFGPDYLVEAQSTLSSTNSDRQPYSSLPSGSVLVRSDLSDGGEGATTLAFAGSSASSSTRQSTWETKVEAKFYAGAAAIHRLKVTADGRYDGLRRTSNDAGRFQFASLADLETGNAQSFERTIGSSAASAGVWNGFIAVGDLWRPSKTLLVNYGVRLEGATYTASPDARADVDARFGLAIGSIPGTVHASPRIGFTWQRISTGGRFWTNDLGSFHVRPASVLRGGIGEFRAITSVNPLVDALAASRGGVPLSCVGSATPSPDWTGYEVDASTIPQACVNGAPAAYVNATRSVSAFAKTFAPPRSWRGNLSYTTRPLGMELTVDGTVSYNLDQPSRIDRNLAAPSFTVPGEGRMVFASLPAIVPASGVISAAGARFDPAFGPVILYGSDGRSITRQFTTTLSPAPFADHYALRVSYVLSSSRSFLTGYEGSAFGAVSDRVWAPGTISRHQFLAQFGRSTSGVTITGIARLNSGRAFTPLVSSDVNGDGLANDRAFVENPSAPNDPALAAPMALLLRDAPKSARDCLTAQLGTAAGHNSCVGPWTTGLDATLHINRPELRARRITSIDFGFVNVLSGVDALVHGANAHGWGQPSSPDPVLYFVRGFDLSTQRFSYAVNPEFGSSRPLLSRLVSPFRITLDVSIDVGTPVSRQQFNLAALQGRGGRGGTKQTMADIRRRYAAQTLDPFYEILRESDSLLLSRTQIDSLVTLQAAYNRQIDPVLNEVAKYVAELGDDFDRAAAFRRQEEAIAHVRLMAWRAVQGVRGLLNPLQLALLPGNAGSLFRMSEANAGKLRPAR